MHTTRLFLLALLALCVSPESAAAGDIYAYVIREGGQWSVHMTKYFSDTAFVQVLLGPAALLATARALDNAGSEDLDVIDGGYLMDFDAKRLELCGFHPDTASVRRLLLPLVREAWPGWTVSWARGGGPGMAVAIGSTLTLDRPKAAELTSVLRDRPDCSFVVTLSGDGPARDYGTRIVRGGLPALLAYGPRMIEDLLTYGKPLAELPHENEIEDGGLLIDRAKKEVHVWSNMTLEDSESWAPEIWAGWKLVVHDDGWPEIVARSGRDAASVRRADAETATLVLEAMDSWQEDPGEAAFQKKIFDAGKSQGHTMFFSPGPAAPATAASWPQLRARLQAIVAGGTRR